jgi:hypothetical protein
LLRCLHFELEVEFLSSSGVGEHPPCTKASIGTASSCAERGQTEIPSCPSTVANWPRWVG